MENKRVNFGQKKTKQKSFCAMLFVFGEGYCGQVQSKVPYSVFGHICQF